ncbi:hypothetical protein G9A89_011373 [Geosiphon pyriformis]|nr:hypothetical protein G9A89_011373 [Geosiphon pyriformis]
MESVNSESLLGLIATTPKAKRMNTDMILGSPFSFPNFKIEKEVELLLPPLGISLEKRWIDFKIEKTPVKVSVRKLFALNINLLAIENKSTTAKTQLIRKIFSLVNGFGGATTLSKFEKIIRFTFTSEKSMEIATLLARKKEININSNLKRQEIRSDWAVVIKKILMDTPKDMIILFLIGKDSVYVAKMVKDHKTWALRDWFRAFLFTLPVETTAYNLGNLLKRADVLIFYLAVFSGKSWAQVVLLANFSGGAYFKSGSSSLSLGISHLGGTLFPILADSSGLDDYLAVLKCSLKLLSDQVFVLLKKLSFVELVLLTASSSASPPVAPVLLAPVLNLDMILDSALVSSTPFSSVGSDLMADFSSSSSKILTTKVGGLESKMVALEALIHSVLGRLDHLCSGVGLLTLSFNLISIITETKLRSKVHPWIANKFDGIYVFTFGLNSGYLSSSVVIVMNFSLVKHMYKVSEVFSWLLSIRFLFKNKLSVSVLGLYAGASSGVWFLQAGEINSLIAKAVNKSSFIILGSNFNEDGSQKCASFKKCIDLRLVNSLMNSLVVNFNAVVDCDVIDVGDYFDTNHQAVSVLVGQGSLLNTQLNFLCKFYKLELLVLKIAKASYKEDIDRFAYLIDCWNSLNNIKASIVQEIMNFGADFDQAKINVIIEGWTRKHSMVKDFSGDWSYQYQSLEYVFNDAFSNVMCLVSFDELLEVISNLSDGKAAGFSEMLNELWKHCDNLVLDMLLVLLNFCLDNFSVLKGITTQSPIFAIDSVIKDVLKKNYELWLVLQDMQKAYDSVK